MQSIQQRKIQVSADAATRLEFARAWLDGYPPDTEILILAHTSEGATDFHLRNAGTRGVWFGSKRTTLNGLASRLAQQQLAKARTAPASALSFIAVVTRAIHSLHGDGKLTYFDPVATKPGFPVAVARTIEELRMNTVPVQAIAGIARGGSDLAAILIAVERELENAKLADRAMIFRAAVDSIAPAGEAQSLLATDWEPLCLPLLLLDVAVRNRLEIELIRLVAHRSPDVMATIPAGDERTISALEEALGCKRDRTSTHRHSPSNGDTSWANSLARAKEYLFAESIPPNSTMDDSLKLSNWPGEPRECVEVVRSIQTEAARGVPFDQMAVLLNSPGQYRSHLEEAFSRAEIPVYFAEGTTAPDPAGRAMLALLTCAAERLSARRFAEYLSLGQVPDPDQQKNPDALWVAPPDELVSSRRQAEENAVTYVNAEIKLGDGVTRRSTGEESETVVDRDSRPEINGVVQGSLRAPWRWERLLVDSAVIGGKDRWVRRLDGLANELRLQLDEAEEEESSYAAHVATQLSDLEHLRAFALPTIDLLAALPGEAKWQEWLTHLHELAVHTLRNPTGVLTVLADLEPLAPVGPVDLYEVQLVLESRLCELSVPPPPRRYGRVYVGPVESARGMVFDIVFIPGLAEKIFPRKLVEDPILPDLQRQETALKGLLTRHDRLEFERLALRLAIGAARERGYLSYARIDIQQSRPRVPSFYALEALRAAEGTMPSFDQLRARAETTTRARLGWSAPSSPASAIDESEYDLALLSTLVDARTENATGGAHYLLSANPHLARALRARFRRWSRRWTIDDGLNLVDAYDDTGRETMLTHRLAARAFSSTALQRYANCPYQFFLNAVLRLRPREEVAAIEVMDPLTRGALFHENQFAILTELKALGQLPVDSKSLPHAYSIVDRVLDEIAQRFEDRLAPAIPRVWRDSIESIRADLREWLRRSSESTEGWVPDKFELAFAMDHVGSQARDPESVSEPLEIAGGLKLRGSIDLVERHPNGKLRVTDHKTGKVRAEKNVIVGGGGTLQPLLYALAAETLLKRPVESGRLYYCTSAGGFEERVVPLNDENRAVVASVISTIDEALADGFLPAAPEDDACNWCDYRAVCGSREVLRSRRKPKSRLTQLTMIRELP